MILFILLLPTITLTFTVTYSAAGLDRESRELERQLAKVQRELEQLESNGGGRSKTKERCVLGEPGYKNTQNIIILNNRRKYISGTCKMI